MNIEELKIENQKVLTEENIDISTLNVEDIIYLEVDGIRIFENLNKIKMGAV